LYENSENAEADHGGDPRAAHVHQHATCDAEHRKADHGADPRDPHGEREGRIADNDQDQQAAPGRQVSKAFPHAAPRGHVHVGVRVRRRRHDRAFVGVFGMRHRVSTPHGCRSEERRM
jgi:hypothetical protein